MQKLQYTVFKLKYLIPTTHLDSGLKGVIIATNIFRGKTIIPLFQNHYFQPVLVPHFVMLPPYSKFFTLYNTLYTQYRIMKK